MRIIASPARPSVDATSETPWLIRVSSLFVFLDTTVSGVSAPSEPSTAGWPGIELPRPAGGIARRSVGRAPHEREPDVAPLVRGRVKRELDGSLRRDSAVDDHRRTRGVGGFVRGEIDGHRRDLLSRAEPSERLAADEILSCLHRVVECRDALVE